MEKIEITTEYIKLDSALKYAGIAENGAHAKEMVLEGLITVNGEKELRRGRKLYKGESQREDGRYEYRYTDANGKRKSVYSWKLTPTDPTPQGKKRGPSLRELKMQIEADVRDGISDANMTVDALWKKFIVSKTDLKDSTRKNDITD